MVVMADPAREGDPDGRRRGEGGVEEEGAEGEAGGTPDTRRRGEAGRSAAVVAALTATRLGRAEAVGRGEAAAEGGDAPTPTALAERAGARGLEAGSTCGGGGRGGGGAPGVRPPPATAARAAELPAEGRGLDGCGTDGATVSWVGGRADGWALAAAAAGPGPGARGARPAFPPPGGWGCWDGGGSGPSIPACGRSLSHALTPQGGCPTTRTSCADAVGGESERARGRRRVREGGQGGK